MSARLLRSAAAAFLLSRGIFFALVILGSQIEFLGKVYGNSVWQTRVVLRGERVLPELARVAMVGDAWWYRSIAREGYHARREAGAAANWAFFPLYPLAVRGAAFTGDFALDGMIVSNAAFAGALLLLGLVAVRSGLTAEDAERAMFYAAFFPTSYFFSLPVTESLFLALSLASILAALSDRWLPAALLGGLAAATRFAGILLVLPLALLFLQNRRAPRWQVASLLLVPAGTAAFMLYLRSLTGDPFAFARIQSMWGRSAGAFWEPLWRFFRAPHIAGEPWNPVLLNAAVALLLIAAAIVLLRRRQWAFGAYTLASVLLPLSTGSLQSVARYALVVFPLWYCLAVAGRRPVLDRVMAGAMIALWGWLVAMLTLRVDFALA